MIKQGLNPVKRPCKPVKQVNQPQYGHLRLVYLCVLLPLGSPTVTSNRVLPLLHGRRTACSRCGGTGPGAWLGGYWGGYTGWVIPGYTQPPARGEPDLRQRSGPRKPLQGAGVGGLRAGGRARCTTPPGPGQDPAGPSLYTSPRMPPPGQ